jgi:hypothetical protein
MAIQLITFGGLHVGSDSGELDWLLAQHTRAALLLYLASTRARSARRREGSSTPGGRRVT